MAARANSGYCESLCSFPVQDASPDADTYKQITLTSARLLAFKLLLDSAGRMLPISQILCSELISANSAAISTDQVMIDD